MARRVDSLLQLPVRAAVAADAAAIVVFAVTGLISHEHGLSGRGLARDVLPFLGAWAGASLLLRTYRRRTWPALGATWLAAIPVGVLIRALVLGRSLDHHQAAFLAVSLLSTGAFVLVARTLAVVLSSRLSPRQAGA